jgi:hypothetical protein
VKGYAPEQDNGQANTQKKKIARAA